MGGFSSLGVNIPQPIIYTLEEYPPPLVFPREDDGNNTDYDSFRAVVADLKEYRISYVYFNSGDVNTSLFVKISLPEDSDSISMINVSLVRNSNKYHKCGHYAYMRPIYNISSDVNRKLRTIEGHLRVTLSHIEQSSGFSKKTHRDVFREVEEIKAIQRETIRPFFLCAKRLRDTGECIIKIRVAEGVVYEKLISKNRDPSKFKHKGNPVCEPDVLFDLRTEKLYGIENPKFRDIILKRFKEMYDEFIATH